VPAKPSGVELNDRNCQRSGTDFLDEWLCLEPDVGDHDEIKWSLLDPVLESDFYRHLK
jgi:hypothetical protein